jgi:hypothetical protein
MPVNQCIVMGAGRAGLSCAIALTRLGLTTVVLERSSRKEWEARYRGHDREAECLRPAGLSELEIRFDFAADRLTRIDDANVLVVWSQARAVIARRVVIAIGACCAAGWLPLERRCGESGRTAVLDVYACGAARLPECPDGETAWRDGIRVATTMAYDAITSAGAKLPSTSRALGQGDERARAGLGAETTSAVAGDRWVARA